MTKSNKILIIGGAGFIGSYIVRKCINEGVEIRALARSQKQISLNLNLCGSFEVIQGDYRDEKVIIRVLKDITDVVYLPCSTIPSSSIHKFPSNLTTNVLPFMDLLQKISKYGSVKRLIFFSSGGTVYGNPKEGCPIAESQVTHPISGYGLEKLITEHYLRIYLAGTGISGYILRPSNVYGKRQNMARAQGAVGIFFDALINNRPIKIYGHGEVIRDYLYASDLADAVWACINNLSSTNSFSIYNVGTGRGTSLIKLVQAMESVSGKQFNINYLPARNFDCRYNVLNADKIKNELGWIPNVPLESGLEKTWSWLRSL